jgi:hypothetical protein
LGSSLASAASGDPTRDPSSAVYENEMDRQSDSAYRMNLAGAAFRADVMMRKAANNPMGLPTTSTRPTPLSDAGQVVSDAGNGYGGAFVYGQQFTPNATSQGVLDVLTRAMEGPAPAGGRRIPLDDFGNPLPELTAAGGGSRVSAATQMGAGAGYQQRAPEVQSLTDLRQQEQTLRSQAEQLAKASQWARDQGMTKAADDYHQAAIKAWYGASSATSQISDINARNIGAISVPQSSSPYTAPGWSYMGMNSSGIDTKARGFAPDYQAVGVGSLSGSAGLARNSYDGTVYMFGGVTQGNPQSISFKPSFTGTLGWIVGAKDAAAVNSFLGGDANQAFVSIPTPWRVNLFGAITHSYGGAYALELGVGNPGKLSYGVTPISHSTVVYDPNKR